MVCGAILRVHMVQVGVQVSAALAGPKRLRSAQESPIKVLKNATSMNRIPRKKIPLENTRANTVTIPWCRRRTPRTAGTVSR